MNQTVAIEMTELPTAGGLSEDPSVLHRVEEFLSQESYRLKVTKIIGEDGCVIEYRSLIDCLVAELAPRLHTQCTKFYQGEEKPLSHLYPADTVAGIDKELLLILEILVSKKWQSWSDFKRDFEAEIKWEPLSHTGFFFRNRSP
jgi:hypothetical protein